jgi:hypothetical protein
MTHPDVVEAAQAEMATRRPTHAPNFHYLGASHLA